MRSDSVNSLISKQFTRICRPNNISATLSAKIFYVQGRQHPVTTYFAEEPQVDYMEAALQTLFQIHVEQPPGDVLVFLPGSWQR